MFETLNLDTYIGPNCTPSIIVGNIISNEFEICPINLNPPLNKVLLIFTTYLIKEFLFAYFQSIQKCFNKTILMLYNKFWGTSKEWSNWVVPKISFQKYNIFWQVLKLNPRQVLNCQHHFSVGMLNFGRFQVKSVIFLSR